MIVRLLAFTLAVLTFTLVFSAQEAEASKQCIYNNSGTSLKVTWYNASGKKDKGASNNDLTVWKQACQNNDKLGFAKIECNGCAWAEAAAKTAIVVGATGAFGVCVVATGGECVAEAPLFAEATYEAIMAVPPAFKGKLIVVPNKGKTVKIEGNAFGLKVKK